jgi:diguanylate cyclase (GGDEF)-like protein
VTRSRDEETTTSVTPIHVEAKAEGGAVGDGCLVVIYGPDLGRRIGLGFGNFDIGRSSKSDLPLDQESVSRNHARIARSRDGWSLRDLGSTNGTYVNDLPIQERTLKDGDQIKIGRSILKFMTGGNIEASYHEEIYRLMTVDGLTQLFNRRYFNEALEREIGRAKRYKRGLSLLLLDLDHFKKKNDEYGHVAGDALLKQLAVAVKRKLRKEDIMARVGGEEFAVILPEVDLEGAKLAAEKIRKIVEETKFNFDDTDIPCTISVGCSTITDATEDSKALYAAADAALYKAKEAGRNRIAF